MTMKFNARHGLSVGSTPIDVIDNAGNIVATAINNTPIGSSTASSGTFTTLTTTGQTVLGGVVGSESVRINSTPNAINRWLMYGNTVNGSPRLVTDGTDSAINAVIGAKGSGFITFRTNVDQTEHFRVAHTDSAVNYVQVTGAIVNQPPTISALGSDTNVTLDLAAKNAASVRFRAAGGTNFEGYYSVVAAVNNFGATGSTTGLTPVMAARGSDTNIAATFQSKGTGAINLVAGSSGVNVSNGGTVTALTLTNTGSAFTSAPTVTISAPTSTSGVTATATIPIMVSAATILNGGSGYAVNDVLTVSGGTSTVACQLTVTSVSGGVITGVSTYGTSRGQYTVAPSNPASVTGGSGTGATFTLAFSVANNTTFTITNAGSGYIEQPTVTISGGGGSGATAYATVGSNSKITALGAAQDIYGPGGIAFRTSTSHTGTTQNYWLANGTNIAPSLLAITATGAVIGTSASNPIQFVTASGSEQFRIAHTTGSVNYIQVAGSSTASSPIISAQGSDTNISATIQPKGTGAINLAAGSSGVTVSNGGTVTAITRTASGNGYTSVPTITISAPTAPGGVQATATCKVVVNAIAIAAAGTGYAVNDVVTLVGGTASASATFTITEVSAGGVVTALTSQAFGLYSVVPANPVSVTGGTGTGLRLNLLWGVDGSGFTITNAGSGYVEQPTITFSGGGGSGAAAYASIGSTQKIQSLGNTLSFYTPGGEVFRVTDTANATGANIWQAMATTGSAILRSSHATNDAQVHTAGTGGLNLGTLGGWTQHRVAHTANAVNYVQTTGSPTTLSPTISAQGSDANVDFSLVAKGTGSFRFLGNSGTTNAFLINSQSSAANYGIFTATSSGTSPLLQVVGSDTNIDFRFRTQGTGAYQFDTSSINNTQLKIDNTDSAVNYIQVTGGSTGKSVIASSQGSDSNIGFQIRSKGIGDINLMTSAGTNQVVVKNITSAVNYLSLKGSVTGNTIPVDVEGTDTNINLALRPKGTGAIDLAAGSSGVNISNGGTVTAITRTSIGGSYTSVPTVVISAPTLPGGVQATATITMQDNGETIVSGGTGYSVNDILSVVGGTYGTQLQFKVTSVSGGVITGITWYTGGSYSVLPANPVSVTGGTGSGATINISWGINNLFTITNAGSGYAEQPTVTISGGGGSGATAYASVGSETVIRSIGNQLSFVTPNQQTAFSINDYNGSSGTGYWSVFGGNIQPQLSAVGTNSAVVQTASAVPLIFRTAAVEQFRVSHTASAVNYIQATGAATSSSPSIAAQGSDTNVALTFNAKGSSGHVFNGNAGTNTLFNISGASASANCLQVSPSATTFGPTLSAIGSDTNIDVNIVPKGSGILSIANGLSTLSAIVGNTSTGGARLRIVESGSQLYIQGGTGTANSTAKINFASYSSTATTMTVDLANTYVGIGTTSPAYKLEVNGSFAATTKSFIIDHPTKPGWKLRYGSLEGPENGVYVRGKLDGNSVIQLPDYWMNLVDPDSITVNLTPIGRSQQLYVFDITDNTVIVGSDTDNIKCFYTVFAERRDVDKLEVEIQNDHE